MKIPSWYTPLDRIVLSDYENTFIRQYINASCRPDGRSPSESRPVTVQVLPSKFSNLSLMINIGNTSLFVSATPELIPSVDTNGKAIILSTSLTGSHLFLPSLGAAKSGLMVDSDACSRIGLLEKDLEEIIMTAFKSERLINDLSVGAKKSLQWVVKVDAQLLCCDGNIAEALFQSCIEVVRRVRFPEIVFNKKPEFIYQKSWQIKEDVLEAIPKLVCVGKVGSKEIRDPTLEEEMACEELSVSWKR